MTQKHERKMAHTLLPFALLWLALAVPFTLYKSWRLAWPDSANPDERLVFTQTTSVIQSIRDRWLDAKQAQGTLRVAIDGDANWPMAWYSLPLRDVSFVSSAKDLAQLELAHRKKPFQAIFMNERSVEDVAHAFPHFDIYRVPLRAWWVPQPNPTINEILSYFFYREVYPAFTSNNLAAAGKGSANVFYLENKNPNSPFIRMTELKDAELLFQASESSGSLN
jgi:hypothetical protein